MNLVEQLVASAGRQPDRAALVDGRDGFRVTDFGAFRDRVGRCATLFEHHGLRRGDRLLLLQPLSTGLYVSLAAAWSLGAIAVLVDPGSGLRQVVRCLRRCPVQGVVAAPWLLALLPLLPVTRGIACRFSTGPACAGGIALATAAGLPVRAPRELADDAPALLTWTSGSTGEPKGVLRSHGFLARTREVLAERFPNPPGAVELVTLPAFALANLAAGVTSLLPDADLRRPARIDPAALAAQLAAWRVTGIGASPALLERLADHCLAYGRRLPSLGRVAAGGAPVFPRQLRKLRRAFPSAEIRVVYGSSEAEPITDLDCDRLTDSDWRRIASGGGLPVGRPVAQLELRVLRDHHGTDLPMLSPEAFEAMLSSPGTAGEIVVTGVHVLTGYVGGGGDEETKIRVGDRVWHRTGDAGLLDAAGRLWLLGRCAGRIDSDHGRRYPFQVEAIVDELPGVVRCAALADRGQRLLAVEFARPPSPARFAAVARAVAGCGIEQVVALGRLPVDRRHNAKPDYPALVAAVRSRRAWRLRIEPPSDVIDVNSVAVASPLSPPALPGRNDSPPRADNRRRLA